MIKQYKTVLIDMYGVIVENSLGVIPYIYSQFGDNDRERLDRIFKEENMIERINAGEIDSAEFFAAFGLSDAEALMKDYIENHLTLDKGFIDFAEKMQNKYELVLLSNDASEWSRYVTEYYGLNKYFTQKIVSADVKLRKPDMKIFDTALEIIGRSPSECIFVDNNVKNLLAAEEVGISPILFNRDSKHYYGMTVDSFDELCNLIE